MKGDRDRETPSSPAKRSNPVIVQGAEARTIWRSWLRKGGATSGKRLQVAPLSTLEEIGESEWRRVLGRTVRRHFGDSRPLWGGLARLHQLAGFGEAKPLESLGREFKGRHYTGSEGSGGRAEGRGRDFWWGLGGEVELQALQQE